MNPLATCRPASLCYSSGFCAVSNLDSKLAREGGCILYIPTLRILLISSSSGLPPPLATIRILGSHSPSPNLPLVCDIFSFFIYTSLTLVLLFSLPQSLGSPLSSVAFQLNWAIGGGGGRLGLCGSY